MAGQDKAPALDDVATERRAGERAEHDSPKRHGDKLGVAAGAAVETASTTARAEDSPKRHGDKLEHAVGEATKR